MGVAYFPGKIEYESYRAADITKVYDYGLVTYDKSSQKYAYSLKDRNWYRNGRLRPCGPFYAHIAEVRYPQGSYFERETSPGTDWFTKSGTAVFGSSPFQEPLNPRPQSSISLAQLRALKKLKAGGFNAAVALAEGQKTVNMITNRLNMILNFANRAALGNPRNWGKQWSYYRKRQKNSNQVQNAWLELQYGWKPLMADIQGAMEALGSRFQKYSIHVTGRDHDSASLSYQVKPWGGETAAGIDCQNSWEMSHRCDIYAKPDNVSQIVTTSLGLTNPAYLAWELIPFSFVADWFIPIGDFLDALDATRGWTFVDGSVSFRSVKNYNGTVCSITKNYAGTWHARRMGACRHFEFETQRWKLGSFPAVPAPRFKNPISTGHCANALALVVQAFRRKP